jgi:plastocyanin
MNRKLIFAATLFILTGSFGLPAQASTVVVDVSSSGFDPLNINIVQNDTVDFHPVADPFFEILSLSGPQGFFSGIVTSDYFLTFTIAGNYSYEDDLRHNGVIGTISVASAVPEPSTWAMMILGFAGLGFLGYRRRQSAFA